MIHWHQTIYAVIIFVLSTKKSGQQERTTRGENPAKKDSVQAAQTDTTSGAPVFPVCFCSGAFHLGIVKNCDLDVMREGAGAGLPAKSGVRALILRCRPQRWPN